MQNHDHILSKSCSVIQLMSYGFARHENCCKHYAHITLFFVEMSDMNLMSDEHLSWLW